MNCDGIQNTLLKNGKNAERRCSAFSVSEAVIGARNERPRPRRRRPQGRTHRRRTARRPHSAIANLIAPAGPTDFTASDPD